MTLKRFIYIYTKSIEKVKEIQDDFICYNIIIKQINPNDIPLNINIDENIKNNKTINNITYLYKYLKKPEYIDDNGDKIKILGLIIEKTILLDSNMNEIVDINKLKYNNLLQVKHNSKCYFYTTYKNYLNIKNNNNYKIYNIIDVDNLENIKIKEELYETVTDGLIDITKLQIDIKKFGWDDIFVVSESMKSYLELLNDGQKVSSRNINISNLIENHIYYKKKRDLTYNPQNLNTVIDFKHNLFNYFNSIPEFNNNVMKTIGINNLIINSYNQGLFIKSSETRRQSIYWCPGLNAGMPLISKPKDRIHELTFQFHDISHFNIPDLIPDFNIKYNNIQRHVYITYRLISECITLVLADMIFVYSLLESGYEYKTINNRKIYPIFKSIIENPDNDFENNKEYIIKKVLLGSFEYCFYKNTNIWKKLMKTEDHEVLNNFSDKYDTYFIEDFKWTSMNYDDILKNKDNITSWWNNIKNIRNYGKNLELYSVSEFIELNNINVNDNEKLLTFDEKKNINTQIFNSVYNMYIHRIFNVSNNNYNFKSNLQNAFIRYAIGQSRIYFKYIKYKNTISHFNTFINAIKLINFNLDESYIYKQIDNIINFYKLYLNKLYKSRFINQDDINTYSVIYPLFNPHYINYDIKNNDISLEEFVKFII
jgi:inosine/xanthosine triphosphate pyrophosphatase family protein